VAAAAMHSAGVSSMYESLLILLFFFCDVAKIHYRLALLFLTVRASGMASDSASSFMSNPTYEGDGAHGSSPIYMEGMYEKL
jgi:hypothetical protein